MGESDEWLGAKNFRNQKKRGCLVHLAQLWLTRKEIFSLPTSAIIGFRNEFRNIFEVLKYLKCKIFESKSFRNSNEAFAANGDFLSVVGIDLVRRPCGLQLDDNNRLFYTSQKDQEIYACKAWLNLWKCIQEFNGLDSQLILDIQKVVVLRPHFNFGRSKLVLIYFLTKF